MRLFREDLQRDALEHRIPLSRPHEGKDGLADARSMQRDARAGAKKCTNGLMRFHLADKTTQS